MTNEQKRVAEAIREAWEHGHTQADRRHREDLVASLTQRLTEPDRSTNADGVHQTLVGRANDEPSDDVR